MLDGGEAVPAVVWLDPAGPPADCAAPASRLVGPWADVLWFVGPLGSGVIDGWEGDLLRSALFLAAVIIELRPGKEVATSAMHVGQLQF